MYKGLEVYKSNLINPKLRKKIILSRNIGNIFKTYNKISSNLRKKIIDVRKIDQKEQIEIINNATLLHL